MNEQNIKPNKQELSKNEVQRYYLVSFIKGIKIQSFPFTGINTNKVMTIFSSLTKFYNEINTNKIMKMFSSLTKVYNEINTIK